VKEAQFFKKSCYTMRGWFELGSRSKIKVCPKIDELIRVMEWNGIMKCSEQSEILERENGIKIPPHYLMELRTARAGNLMGNDQKLGLIRDRVEGLDWSDES
jgi:hypothetical protein